LLWPVHSFIVWCCALSVGTDDRPTKSAAKNVDRRDARRLLSVTGFVLLETADVVCANAIEPPGYIKQ